MHESILFHHSRAPPRFARRVRNNFPDSYIGRGEPIARPPRFPDLTPLQILSVGMPRTAAGDIRNLTRQLASSGAKCNVAVRCVFRRLEGTSNICCDVHSVAYKSALYEQNLL
jgi:hypothetical protein